MTTWKKLLGRALCPTVIAVSTLGMATPAAWSQPVTYRVLCTNYGAGWSEPIGDREGHSLQVAEASCTMQGGPMDGAVGTQQVVWEFDKGVGTFLSAHTVYRKPGAMAVTVGRSGRIQLQFTDGRLTGWTGNGAAVFSMATGSASALEKRTASWTGRPTGNRTYVLEFTVD